MVSGLTRRPKSRLTLRSIGSALSPRCRRAHHTVCRAREYASRWAGCEPNARYLAAAVFLQLPAAKLPAYSKEVERMKRLYLGR